MPVTAVTFGLGYLAIIGLPPFAGFFSKDKIIESAYGEGGVDGWILGSVALLGAGITAFYMTRVMCDDLLRPAALSDDVHPHESPPVMTVPMIVLAVGSAFSGLLLTMGGSLQNFLEPVVGEAHEEGVHAISPNVLIAITLLGRRWRRGGGGAAVRPPRRPGHRARRPSVPRRSPPAATSTRTTSTRRSSCGRGSTSRARWCSPTTAASTVPSTAWRPLSAARPAACGGCRPASSARTPCRCSAASSSSSAPCSS
jgi:hypothetical protein